MSTLKRFTARHPVMNWALPWAVFLIVFCLCLCLFGWAVALLGGVVAGAITADHCCG